MSQHQIKMKNKIKYFNNSLWINDFKNLLSFCLTIGFILVATQIFAQKSISSSQLLSAKPMIEGNEILQKNLHFLKESKQGLPLINSMEFRTETDEFDLSQQEYLLRLSFNNKKTRKIQNALTNNKINLYDLKSKNIESLKLSDRYELIIELHYLQKEISILNEEKILKEDKKSVYQKKLNNSADMNIDDLLKVNKDLLEIDLKLLQLNLSKKNILKVLIPDFNRSDSLELISSDWISLEKMSKTLRNIEELPYANFDVQLQNNQIHLEKLSLEKQKAKSNQILDFVQLKYADKDNLQLQKEISLGVGINIPIKSSSRIKLNEAKLKLFDEQYKQELLQVNLEKRISEYTILFHSLLKQYNFLQKQIKENKLEEILENYKNMGSANPINLLQIKSSILDNHKTLQNIEKEACIMYYKILSEKGVLNLSPYINYLSDKLYYYNIK